MEHDPPEFLNGPRGRLAYRQRPSQHKGRNIGFLWLGGYRSDMLGSKACFVDEWCKHHDCAFTRFDYSGHGESDGAFEEGAISDWAEDALEILDKTTNGHQIIIGSSMGAWIGALLAKARPERIAGALFIAPAPDFATRLLWPSFSPAQQAEVTNKGKVEIPSEFSDEPDVYTARLIEDGRNCEVLNEPLVINGPVRILQGMKDEAVPYGHALQFAEIIDCPDLLAIIVKDGDHRLSEPADLKRLGCILEGFIN